MLIIGATGLLGTNVCLQADGTYDVYGMARGSTAFPPGCTPIRLDVTEGEATLRCLNEVGPQVILHCAAMTNVERCEAEPKAARLLHVEASRNLAKWAVGHGGTFVYISTDSVFDGQSGNYNEEDSPAPLNEYARTKLAGEIAARLAHPSALILRTNFYGSKGAGNPSLAEWMLGKLQSGQRIKAFADVRFNPLLARYLAKVILELIARGATGTFHVGARNACSKYEFAVQLARIFGFDSERVVSISVDQFPFEARRPKNTTLAVEKICRILATTMPSVEDGLSELKNMLTQDSAAIRKSRLSELHSAVDAR